MHDDTSGKGAGLADFKSAMSERKRKKLWNRHEQLMRINNENRSTEVAVPFPIYLHLATCQPADYKLGVLPSTFAEAISDGMVRVVVPSRT